MAEIDPKRPNPDRVDPNRVDPNRSNLDRTSRPRNRYASRWWLWLIILIIIIFLIWWWAGGWNNRGVPRDAVGPAPIAGVDQGAGRGLDNRAGAPVAGAAGGGMAGTAGGANAAAMTSLAGVSASQLTSMAGRRVDLNRVQVQSVVGDTGFYVGSSEQDRVFVMSSEHQGANAGGDNQSGVTAGSMVDIKGTIESASSTQAQGTAGENTAGQGMAAGVPSGTQAYVAATEVRKVQ